jgi:hypothetical protein
MASNHHTDEVFTPKRKPKNPIKFQLQLNEEQKLAKALIVENPVVTVLKGMAGSGKHFSSSTSSIRYVIY